MCCDDLKEAARYVCIDVYVCIYVCIYITTYDFKKPWVSMTSRRLLGMCVYMYEYMYVYISLHITLTSHGFR